MKAILIVILFLAAVLGIGIWQNVHDFQYHLRHDCVKFTDTGTKWDRYTCPEQMIYTLKSEDK